MYRSFIRTCVCSLILLKPKKGNICVYSVIIACDTICVNKRPVKIKRICSRREHGLRHTNTIVNTKKQQLNIGHKGALVAEYFRPTYKVKHNLISSLIVAVLERRNDVAKLSLDANNMNCLTICNQAGQLLKIASMKTIFLECCLTV